MPDDARRLDDPGHGPADALEPARPQLGRLELRLGAECAAGVVGDDHGPRAGDADEATGEVDGRPEVVALHGQHGAVGHAHADVGQELVVRVRVLASAVATPMAASTSSQTTMTSSPRVLTTRPPLVATRSKAKDWNLVTSRASSSSSSCWLKVVKPTRSAKITAAGCSAERSRVSASR